MIPYCAVRGANQLLRTFELVLLIFVVESLLFGE